MVVPRWLVQDLHDPLKMRLQALGGPDPAWEPQLLGAGQKQPCVQKCVVHLSGMGMLLRLIESGGHIPACCSSLDAANIGLGRLSRDPEALVEEMKLGAQVLFSALLPGEEQGTARESRILERNS